MGEIRENLKRNLGYYLSLNSMSQKELSERLGVSQAAVTNWIKGKNSPDIELINEMCKLFDVSITDFMGKTEKSPAQAEPNAEDLLTVDEKEEFQLFRQLLIRMGYVGEDDDLTDTQVTVLVAVMNILDATFLGRTAQAEDDSREIG